MTFVDDSGQGGEPPFGDLDLGPAEPAPTGRRRSTAAPEPAPEQRIAAHPAKRLFLGQTAVDFWGRRRIYLGISLLLIIVSVLSLTIRRVNLGIDFEGGVAFDVPAGELSVSDARSVLDAHGIDGSDAKVEERESAQGDIIKVQIEEIPADVRVSLQEAFAATAAVDPADVSVAAVSSSWGEQITRKAVTALLVFLLLFSIVIAIRFEWRMALAAIIAMLHDVIIASGIYSVFGFEVTPPTVIAFLTILGYSLYDTIVVFDRVKENERRIVAAGLGAADLVNVSTNQVLMRSLNTSVSALLPVFSLLLVGALALGQETLLEFALALLIGMLTGAYSSIFVATPVLGVLKGGRRSDEHLVGAELRSVVVRGVGILAPLAGRRRGGRAGAVPAAATVGAASTSAAPGSLPGGLEPSAEQLLGRAPRPRKKKRH
jgi:preprotein translocase subunit SecF